MWFRSRFKCFHMTYFICILFMKCSVIISDNFSHKSDLDTDTPTNLLQTHSQVSADKAGNSTVPLPIYDNCDAYLKEFGYYSSRFIRCSIENARPFRFCENCVIDYQKTMSLHQDIEHNGANKDGCSEKLLNADRIQVLNEVFNNIKNIWQKAFCDACFSHIDEDIDGTVHFTISSDTQRFIDGYNSVYGCIHNHKLPYKDQVNNTVCEDCRYNYTKLNNFYKELRQSTNHSICMDIVDMMNYTRQKWGRDLHCTHYIPDDASIIVITIVFGFMPVIFYLTAKFFVGRKKLKLMIQKRMSVAASKTLHGYGSRDYSEPFIDTPTTISSSQRREESS